MKAISLWQPHASFMAIDFKKNETRGWPTKYRGDIAICSSKRVARYGEFGEEIEQLIFRCSTSLRAQPYPMMAYEKTPHLLPLGFVLCIVEIFDCVPSEKVKPRPLEMLLGNYTPGRFAWLTRNCRRLSKPVPVIGRQGFFNLTSDVERQVTEQL
jgi:hypothetical protein